MQTVVIEPNIFYGVCCVDDAVAMKRLGEGLPLLVNDLRESIAISSSFARTWYDSLSKHLFYFNYEPKSRSIEGWVWAELTEEEAKAIVSKLEKIPSESVDRTFASEVYIEVTGRHSRFGRASYIGWNNIEDLPPGFFEPISETISREAGVWFTAVRTNEPENLNHALLSLPYAIVMMVRQVIDKHEHPEPIVPFSAYEPETKQLFCFVYDHEIKTLEIWTFTHVASPEDADKMADKFQASGELLNKNLALKVYSQVTGRRARLSEESALVPGSSHSSEQYEKSGEKPNICYGICDTNDIEAMTHFYEGILAKVLAKEFRQLIRKGQKFERLWYVEHQKRMFYFVYRSDLSTVECWAWSELTKQEAKSIRDKIEKNSVPLDKISALSIYGEVTGRRSIFNRASYFGWGSREDLPPDFFEPTSA